MPLSGLSEGRSHEGHSPVVCSSGGILPPPPPGIAQVSGLEPRPEWGEHMQQSLEPDESDKNVECSARIVLECGCGERLILLGLEEDWRSEQRTDFGCSCGENLTLSNRLNEEVLEFRRVMRDAFKIPSG